MSVRFFDSWIDNERKIYQNVTMNFTSDSFALKSIINDYYCDPERVVYAGSGINISYEPDIGNKRHKNKDILFVGIDWERKRGA